MIYAEWFKMNSKIRVLKVRELNVSSLSTATHKFGFVYTAGYIKEKLTASSDILGRV
jgi:hypothetical protein